MDEAIATAATLNRNERLTVFRSIVSVRDDSTEAQLNAIAQQLGHSDFATHIESDSKAIEFADDPITAWNVLVTDELNDFSQLDSLVLVAETIIEEQGFDALFHLHEPFDVGFCASWCAPCIATIPELKDLLSLYNKNGFEIESVSIDDNFHDWEQAFRRTGSTMNRRW